jgi:tetratricopeptide (TPR) repeat protein
MKELGSAALLAVLPLLLLAIPVNAQTVQTANLNFSDVEVTDTELVAADTAISTTTAPNSFWYGFKRFGEGIREFFTWDAMSKAKLHLEFAKERLAEAKTMAELNRTEEVQKLLDEYQAAISQVENRTRELARIGQNVSEIVHNADDVLLKSTLVLQLVHDKVPEQAKPAIERAINTSIAKKANIAVQKRRWEIRERIAQRLNKTEEIENLTEKVLEKEAEIDKELENEAHVQRALRVTERLKERIENQIRMIESNLTSETANITELEEKKAELLARLEQKLAQLGNETMAIERVRERVEERIKALNTTMAVRDEIREIVRERINEKIKEAETKIAEHKKEMQERVLERLEDAKKTLEEAKEKLGANATLVTVAQNRLERAEAAIEAGKIGEAFGQITATQAVVKNAIRTSERLEAIEEKIKELKAMNQTSKELEAIKSKTQEELKQASATKIEIKKGE